MIYTVENTWKELHEARNDYVGFDKSTRTGAWGRPSEATAERGADQVARTLEHQVRYIRWARARVAELKTQASNVPQR